MENTGFYFNQAREVKAENLYDIESVMTGEDYMNLTEHLSSYAGWTRNAVVAFEGDEISGEMYVKFHNENTSFTHEFGVEESEALVIDSIEAYRYDS